MATTAAAKRYAQAIFELAIERGELDRWREELPQVAEALTDATLAPLLESPRVPFTSKQELLQASLKGLSPLALNLSYLLAKKGKAAIASRIASEYVRLLDSHQGIEHAEVVSAVPLSQEEREAISRRLGEVTGRRVVLESRTDPAIIGGLVIRIGDRLIDGSVRTRLQNLKRDLGKVGGRA
ncbi:MAG: ATP synthase F1 subunit delta [Chloroflexota bacterium]